MGRTPRSALLMALLVALLGLPAAAGARTPALGLTDDSAFASESSAARAVALGTAREAGARYVRITLDWSRVAPAGGSKPPGFDGSDPYDERYSWTYIDDAVRDATRAGLEVILVVTRAPAWAEGSSRPESAPLGSWRPDPEEFADFMRAATRHFSGFFPDFTSPGDGITGEGYALPEVRYWQVWHEPNSGETLRPARSAVRQSRRLLRAADAAANRLGPRTMIVAGATGPGGAVTAVRFWRELLCLGRAGRRAGCPAKARFDVAAHDPSTRRAPGRLLPAGDVGLAQLRKLRQMLRRAARQRTVRPARRKPLWLSGVGWHAGAPPVRAARYLVRALFLADRARAGLFAWDRLEDGTPAFRAYRFPFLVHRTRGRARAWGVAPRPGARVRVEVKARKGWRRMKSVRGSRSREFHFRVPDRRGRVTYRARQGQAKSLPWRF